MASNIDIIGALGTYWDEADLRRLLLQLGITKAPQMRSGDHVAFLENHASGIEVTFIQEDWMDYRPRDYPTRVLVLNNVRFYAEPVHRYQPHTGPLPLGLRFGLSEAEVLDLLGPAHSEILTYARKVRWDRADCSVFAEITSAGTLGTVSFQLPIVPPASR